MLILGCLTCVHSGSWACTFPDYRTYVYSMDCFPSDLLNWSYWIILQNLLKCSWSPDGVMIAAGSADRWVNRPFSTGVKSEH